MSRFGGNPFSNPFASNSAPVRDPVSTGSLAKAGSAASGVAGRPGMVQQVQAAPLAPPAMQQQSQQPLQQAQQQVPQGVSPAMERAAMQTGSLGTMPGASALRQASPATRPLSTRAAGVTGNAAGWTAQGGTPVVLAHGETIDTLSQRYGVPAAAIVSSNGLSSASQATPGSRVVIPVYNVEATKAGAQRLASASGVQSDADISRPVSNIVPTAPAADPVRPLSRPPAPVAQPATQPQQRGMTAAEIRAAAQAKAKQGVEAKVGDQKIPERKPSLNAEAKAKQAAEAKEKAAAAAKAKLEAKAKTDAEAKARAEAKAAEQASRKVAALPAEEPKTTSSVPKEAEKSESSKAEFRWPARGRIINGFSGRGGNEGINIAVPEGTPVKAAEGGTVAYAGSELKGYGNLVLIRHDNGYVSAYAHNGDINVKRGEKVNRGQVIAKSGQSGNVSSPQLHFELRKGSSPVDPTPYLTN